MSTAYQVVTRADVEEIVTRVGNQIIDDISVQFGDMAQMLHQKFERVDQQFARVDERFEQVGRQFERVDQQINSLKQDIQTIKQELNAIRIDMEEMKLDIRLTKAEQQAIRNDLKEFYKALYEVRTKVQRINDLDPGEFKVLKQEVQRLKSWATDIGERAHFPFPLSAKR